MKYKEYAQQVMETTRKREAARKKQDEASIATEAAQATKIVATYLKKFRPEAIRRALAATGILLKP